MDGIRKSKLSESRAARAFVALTFASLALAIPACGQPPPPVTAVSLPDAPRRPDGVVLEPRPALPSTQDRADARGGVVALREPLGGEAVTSVARAMFAGFAREDLDALTSLLLEPDRGVLLDGPRGPHSTLREVWAARLRDRDYKRLGVSAGAEVARFDAIERWSYEDLGALSGRERPPEMREGDLLVRIPVLTPRLGNETLFGDMVTLLLRRDGSAYKIVGFGDDDGRAR